MKKTSEKITEEEAIAYQYPELFAKSNILIGAKYKSSLLENKLMAISLSRIQYDEKSNVLYSKMKASEIIKLVGGNKGSFYKQLDETASVMTGKTIGISDPNKQEFTYIAVITRADYKNSELTIQYHSDLKNYLYNIKNNFTKLQLSIMLSFKNVYSFRMYELLKSKAFYPKGQEREDKVFTITMSLSELKLQLGIVNSELDDVRKILRNTKNPDYDKAVAKSPERMFDTWYDFKRYVIDKSVKEINEKTDMHVEYKTQSSGKGGKVYGIEFTIDLNIKCEKEEVEKEIKIMTEEDKFQLLEKVYILFGGIIGLTDCKKLCEKAEYNYSKIEKAFNIFNSNKSEIENVIGWLLKAIDEEWNNKTIKSKKKIANDFNNFKQNSIEDWDSFESKILSN